MRLPPPKITFQDGALRPFNLDYGDIYFDGADIQAEIQHVFIKGIDLPNLWAGRDHFQIGETGFGTGLNFLVLWRFWLDQLAENPQTTPRHLSFSSFEKAPLTLAQLTKIHAGLPEILRPLAKSLRAALPPPLKGFHHSHIKLAAPPNENTRHDTSLTLILGLGQAQDLLPLLQPSSVDAWFLDGFAPAKNPDLWQGDLLGHIGRLTKSGGQLASFSVAASVREGLQAAGFDVEKQQGYGRKRHCLTAVKQPDKPNKPNKWQASGQSKWQVTDFAATTPSVIKPRQGKPVSGAPWFDWPVPDHSQPPPAIAIIGAGIAATMLAFMLYQRGHKDVTIYDKGQVGPASHVPASYVPLGVMIPAFSRGDDAFSRWNHDVGLASLRFWGQLAAQHKPIKAALHKAPIWLKSDYEMDWGFPKPLMKPTDGGYLLPAIPHFQGPELLNALAGLAPFLTKQVEIGSFARQQGRWQLYDKLGTLCGQADRLVIAAGASSADLLAPYLGEFHGLKAAKAHIHIAPDHKEWPRHGVSCGPLQQGKRGFISAALKGQRVFAIDDDNQQAALGFHKGADKGQIWQNIRLSTSDHFPLLGPVPDLARYGELYGDLPKGVKGKLYDAPSYNDGLYLFTGLGARGFLNAPWLATRLADLLLYGSAPMAAEFRHGLHPARFWIRALKTGGAVLS